MKADLQEQVDKGLLSHAEATREALRQHTGLGERLWLRLGHGVSTAEQKKRVRGEELMAARAAKRKLTGVS